MMAFLQPFAKKRQHYEVHADVFVRPFLLARLEYNAKSHMDPKIKSPISITVNSPDVSPRNHKYTPIRKKHIFPNPPTNNSGWKTLG